MPGAECAAGSSVNVSLACPLAIYKLEISQQFWIEDLYDMRPFSLELSSAGPCRNEEN